MNNQQSNFFAFKAVTTGIIILYFAIISFYDFDKKQTPLEEKMIYTDQVIETKPFRMSM